MDVSTSVTTVVYDGITNVLIHAILKGPGSFLEVRKILPLLTATSPKHPSFNVVAFSLPGYGFSEAPRNKGFRSAQYAEVCMPIALTGHMISNISSS